MKRFTGTVRTVRVVRIGLALTALVAAVWFGMAPAPALAAAPCPHPEPTIPALQGCVRHAAATGAIGSAGVTASLLTKLDAAQAAVARGRPAVAALLLGAFIREVAALAGRLIEADHAAHMVAHARAVLAALRGP
jgi:hypothetical protein